MSSVELLCSYAYKLQFYSYCDCIAGQISSCLAVLIVLVFGANRLFKNCVNSWLCRPRRVWRFIDTVEF